MFFTKLTRKTHLKRKKELKYKLLFWNPLYGVSDAILTHKLDYLPEEWFVVQCSSLQPALVYDIQTINEGLYSNLNALALNIQSMTIEHKIFPPLDRTIAIVDREYFRVRRTHKRHGFRYNLRQEQLWKFNYVIFDSFLTANTVFAYRLKKINFKPFLFLYKKVTLLNGNESRW